MIERDVFMDGLDEPVGRLAGGDDLALGFRTLGPGRDGGAESVSLPAREEPFGDVEARGFFSNLPFKNEQLQQVMDLTASPATTWPGSCCS